MAGDPLKKVQSGQRLEIPAAAWNAIVDTVEAHRRGQHNVVQGLGSDFKQPVVVKVRNASGSPQDRFAVLAVRKPIILPADNLLEFQNHYAFEAYVPATPLDEENIVVLQEPLLPRAIGRAVIAGVTPVRLNVLASKHRFAEPVAGVTILRSEINGRVLLLWKERGLGLKWALAFLLAPTSVALDLVTQVCPLNYAVEAVATSGIRITESTRVDVPGTAVSFDLAVAAKVLVTGIFDLISGSEPDSTPVGDIYVCDLCADGWYPPGQATFCVIASDQRAVLSQTWLLDLSAGPHSLQLQAYRQQGNEGSFADLVAINTKLAAIADTHLRVERRRIRLLTGKPPASCAVDPFDCCPGSGVGVPIESCDACTVAPSQWKVTLTGIVSGGDCDDDLPADCDGYNGTFLLNYQSGCLWLGDLSGNPCRDDSAGDDAITLSYDAVADLWQLQTTNGPSWQVSGAAWDCLGPNTLTQLSAGSRCVLGTATVVVEPA